MFWLRVHSVGAQLKTGRSSIPDAMVESIVSGSMCDRPCSSLLMLLMSVDSPFDQIVAEDRLLMLLLQ